MVKLYDFYADWCGPCKQQDPIVEELEDEYDDDEFEVEKVDADENRETANQYQVRSLPTLVLVEGDDDNEQVLDRFVGLTDKDTLADAIDDAV